jgi:hypothetical protein
MDRLGAAKLVPTERLLYFESLTDCEADRINVFFIGHFADMNEPSRLQIKVPDLLFENALIYVDTTYF